MADNVAITAGTGTTVAADEITDGTLGSVKVQYVKLMDGTLDSTTKIGGAIGLPTTTLASTIPTATNMQTAAVAVGNGTNLNVLGYASAIISLTGTMGASTAVTFEASVDDTTFVSIAGHQIGLAGNLAVTTTNTGDFRFNVAAYKSIRARVSVFGTGSVTAKGYASAAAGHGTTVNANIIAALPTGANTVGNVNMLDGAGNAIVTTTADPSGAARGLIARLAPGTNTIGGVKIAGSLVSTVNSTAVALAANGVFTGTSEDITQYSSVSVQLISNVASATDGLSMQQSPDGTNWDNIDAYSIPAATGKNFGVHVSANFFRVVYTNGATLQGSFRLQTIYHMIGTATSSVRPQDARTNDNDMQEVLGYGMVYDPVTNTWSRLRGTGGAANVAITPATLAITATAAVSTAVTATLPAAGAGLFHYITRINLVKYASVAVVGAAAPVVITTTNLPGSLAYTTPTAQAIGTQWESDIAGSSPMKSSVANTATTIVCPLTTSVIWRVNVYYYTAA